MNDASEIIQSIVNVVTVIGSLLISILTHTVF